MALHAHLPAPRTHAAVIELKHLCGRRLRHVLARAPSQVGQTARSWECRDRDRAYAIHQWLSLQGRRNAIQFLLYYATRRRKGRRGTHERTRIPGERDAGRYDEEREERK